MAYDDEVEVGTTRWASRAATPLRAFAGAETGGATILVAAVVAAVVWCTVAPRGYDDFWDEKLRFALGGAELARPLRVWVNSGLMTLFFLLVGLEARREFDLGDLRERRRFLLPCAAGLAGMAIAVVVFLAVLHGEEGSGGWGVVMSTDTALALGLLSVVGRGLPDRLRVFLVTVFVVDDLVALLVVTFAYTDDVRLWPLVVAVIVAVVLALARRFVALPGLVTVLALVVAWVALLRSGVDPIVLGLVAGLATSAYAPTRGDLEQATALFRGFREQPTPELARAATAGVARSLSANALLQSRLEPWVAYLVVPLFALANAGIDLSPGFLGDAYADPLTVGIIVAYVVGKPVGVVVASWLVERASGGSVRPAVGWAGVIGSGALAGIGFTVSFIVADLAFNGERLAYTKLGVLTAAVLSTAVASVVFAVTGRLAEARRARALLGQAEPLIDLSADIDDDRDHVRGSLTSPVTLVEYGDLECPYCGQAEPIVRELLSDVDVRYVWRHLPLTDVHPHAQIAAEASEAAAAQGRFWEMHDALLAHQDRLTRPDLIEHARALGLDMARFEADLREHRFVARVARDVDSASVSGVAGTPTFFINGQRHHGVYDVGTLTRAIETARARALLTQH